jgi:mono/diheme cytochrome c family protein
LLLSVAGSAQADGGKELFESRCAGCHTIGGGEGAGPDLTGVGARRPAQWLARIITEPDKLTSEKDATQVELVKKFGMEMPNLGVSREDALRIVAFLQGGAAQGAAKAASPAGTPGAPAAEPRKEEPAPTPELLSMGRALFTGKTPMANAGAPCISCHSLRYPGVYGGSLAGDLTGIYSKIGGNGVRAVLKSLSFPVMKRIYAQRPLNESEVSALLALLKDAAAGKPAQADPYPLAGLGCFAFFLVVAMLFKRRNG